MNVQLRMWAFYIKPANKYANMQSIPMGCAKASPILQDFRV